MLITHKHYIMKYTLSIIIFFLLTSALFSQKLNEQANELKNSVLLVRLMTQQTSIDALKEAGHYDQAKLVEENREITSAFEQEWTLTPVYYFYTTNTKQIRERQFGEYLIDANLNHVFPEENIDNFFVAQFWFIEPEDYKYFTHTSYSYEEDGYKHKTKNYGGDTNLGPDALILRDSSFVQLKDPFPFYVRTYEGLPIIRRAKPKAVRKLQEKIEKIR